MKEFISLTESVVKEVMEINLPVMAKNLGMVHCCNEIEITNVSNEYVKDILVELSGVSKEDYYWEDNGDERWKKKIAYLLPKSSETYYLRYIDGSSIMAKINIKWKDRFNVTHTQEQEINIIGICN